MTDELDPRLQELFAARREELDGEAFTDRVMARTRYLKYRVPALIAGITVMVVLVSLLLMPALEGFAYYVAVGLTTALIDLGEGWLAFFLAPVNTVGSLLILSAKLIRVAQKKLLRVSVTA